MWLVLPTGFISIVQDRDDADMLWIRARVREDIANFLPAAFEPHIQTMPKADYTYRICVPRTIVKVQMADQIMNQLDYTSHAKEVMNRRSHPNAARMTAMYDVWSAMANMQDYTPFTGTKRKVVSRSIKYSAPKKTGTGKSPLGSAVSTGDAGAGEWSGSRTYGRDYQWPESVLRDDEDTWPIPGDLPTATPSFWGGDIYSKLDAGMTKADQDAQDAAAQDAAVKQVLRNRADRRRKKGQRGGPVLPKENSN